MTTFLFWNLNKKPLERLVADLARRHEVDVLILAECEIPTDILLVRLNRRTARPFVSTYSLCKGIVIYTRFSSRFIEPRFESERLTIREITLPRKESLLLVAVHLPSKLYWSGPSQSSEC